MATQCTPDTPIRGPSLSKPDVWIRYIRDRGGQRMDEVANFVRETYRLAAIGGISAHLIVGQAIHETGMFTSTWWVERLNPGGLDIIGDRAHDLKSRYYPNGTVAARAMMVHVCLYVLGELPGEIAEYRHEDPRADQIPDDALGHRTTLGQFGHAAWWEWVTWAADDDYGVYWAARMNAAAAAGVFDQVQTPPAGDGTGGAEKEPSVEYKAYRFPGAPRDAYLPAWIKVSIRPVDHPRVRSYQKAPNKRYTTVHDTGNPRTNAEGEYSWLAGGRQGGEVGGYQWINDDRILIITGYFDEVTWAQGTPDGNRLSDAGEMAYGGSVVWNDALEICCAMHGAVIDMRGLDPNDAAVLHQWWYGKWCSAQILNRGLWPVAKQKIAGYAKSAAQARKGGVPIPAPTVYAKPVPVVDPATNLPWDGAADIVVNGNTYEAQKVTGKTTGVLNKRQWAGTESQMTGMPYAAGVEVDLLGWVKGQLVDGISEWWIDTAGNRLWAGGIDIEPKQDPDWPELPSEMPPGMTGVNGHAYYPLYPDDLTDDEIAALNGAAPPLGRKITIRQDGKLYKWANPASGAVGEVTAGEERVFKYWTRGEPAMATAPDGTEFEEVVWYAEDLHTGGRMWAGLSDEKPD